jgi:D-alanine-D-alanine ligase
MTSHDMHILVLAGGLSAERDVSLRSGRRVAEALRDQGHTVEVADVDSSLLARLKADPPAAVVPLVHGAAGEDGALRDVLDALNIAYVGSTGDACRAAFDKPAAAARMRAHGINVPHSVALPHSTFRDLGATSVLDAFAASLGVPLVVKPTRGGSALGVSIVNDANELSSAMVGAFAYGDTVMLEQYIDGVEIAVSIFDDGTTALALPAVEIQPDAQFYDYQCRYTAGATEFFVPARLDEAVLTAANDMALTAHRELGLRDWSRADIIVDSAGQVHLLEMCVAPGMTETSLYPQAIAAAGFELGDLTAQLVRAAIDRANA